MSVTLNGTNGLTFNDGSSQATAATGFGFKNRIINGGMVIDQRNAGASITVNMSGEQFPVDRFQFTGQATDGVYTVQQDSSAPAGFVSSIKATVTTADASIGASQIYFAQHKIEGTNVADLAWGSASAKTVTLSFWVRSSLTGTFSGSVSNSNVSRSYPFIYSILSADTWEYKTVTIAGDTSGTWLTTTGIGVRVIWSLGMGSTYNGTAGAWAGADYRGVTGATNLIGTLNATWYITGVQLEKGSTATNFDYRPYGTELALCQRYYFRNTQLSLILAEAGFATATTSLRAITKYPVPMRTAPTALEQTGTATDYRVLGAGASITACNSVPTFNSATEHIGQTNFSVASGLTAYTAGTGAAASGITAYLGWSAEL